jgi:phage gpG-like protein
MLTLSINVDGIQRKIKTLARTAKDLEPALKIFDRYYRARVDQRFASEGPGWPPRADSTEAKSGQRERQAHALAAHQLKRKLTKELKRALRRQRLGKGTAAAAERRYLVLKEFERQVAGGILGEQAGADRRLEKSIVGLRARKARADAQASGRVLGRMASSMFSKIAQGTLIVDSKIPWAGSHNEGDTVGHGARLPARPFNYLEEIDVEVLTEVLIRRMLVAVGE